MGEICLAKRFGRKWFVPAPKIAGQNIGALMREFRSMLANINYVKPALRNLFFHNSCMAILKLLTMIPIVRRIMMQISEAAKVGKDFIWIAGCVATMGFRSRHWRESRTVGNSIGHM